MNTHFTVEEENIVAIYLEDTRESLIRNIQNALAYMDSDMQQLADTVIRKLQAMTDSEFSETQFSFTDE